jgi:RNA polymerase sigma factor (sigma-70 family)
MDTTEAADDQQLLRCYAAEQSEDAFRELVRRHVNLVYSAALRQVRAPQLAEEVAQSAFTDLAQRAGSLKADTVLAAWLHQVTRRTAIDVVRREARRQLREQIATEMNAVSAPNEPNVASAWTDIKPLLDEAISTLDEADRVAVLLRYFENKPLREVGRQLGVSDDAAQKRVSRAVERLRDYFARRGVAASASGLALLVSANAVQSAPLGLVASLSATALAGTAVTTPPLIATTAKTVAMTTLQKTLVTATVAVLAGASIYQAKQAHDARAEVQALQQQQAPLTEQIQNLQNRFTAATNRLADMAAENVRLESNSERNELLKLRGMVGSLTQKKDELSAENELLHNELAVDVKSMPSPKQMLFNVQRVCTINSAKEIALAMRVYASGNGNFPTNFNAEVTDYLEHHVAGDKTPSTIGLNSFEVIAGMAPLASSADPPVILFRERQARQTPDGKWERVYAFSDGSAWPQVTDDGNFTEWENQHMPTNSPSGQ